MIFPDLEEVIRTLINGLHDEQWEELQHLAYFGLITLFGGKECVLKAAMDSLQPLIKGLKAKELTVPR